MFSRHESEPCINLSITLVTADYLRKDTNEETINVGIIEYNVDHGMFAICTHHSHFCKITSEIAFCKITRKFDTQISLRVRTCISKLKLSDQHFTERKLNMEDVNTFSLGGLGLDGLCTPLLKGF